MSLAKLIFDKSFDELSIHDIESFFQIPQEETEKLEFKSFADPVKGKTDFEERTTHILKSICAFLNSEGGVLIWGAPVTTRNPEGKNTCVGPLTPFPNDLQKDRFMSKLADSIDPTPQGILIKQLQKNDGFIYLFEVAKSVYSPHQYKNIYYMRMDGQTRIAPHSYIEALCKKISFPNLEGYLRLDQYAHLEGDFALLQCSVIFRNQSPFMNDFNLHYRVMTDHGAVFNPDENLTMAQRNYNPSIPGDYIVHEVAKTIYYGNWLDSRFRILLSRSTLHSNNYNLKIRLQFGAKHSPMKISLYEIVIGENNKENLNEHFLKIRENRFFTSVEEDMNMPDAERLKAVLGR